MPKKGFKHSAETRAKMSASHKGKRYSPRSLETRQKISESLKGTHQSMETRRRRGKSQRAYWESLTLEQRQERGRLSGEAHEGWVMSQETKDKISQSNREHWANLTTEEREEKAKPFIGNVPSEETCQKISEANIGQKRTSEQCQRMRDSWTPERLEKYTKAVSAPKSPEHRKKISDAHKKYWKELTPEEQNDVMKRRCENSNPSSLELMIRAELDSRGIIYEPQYPLLRYTIDIAFPDSKLAVEADGEYWHSHPDRVIKDEKRDSDLEEEGWRTIRFPESQILADVVNCADKIVQALA